MTPKQLERTGQKLFGNQWKSPLARAIGKTYRQVLRYAKGEAEIPVDTAIAIKCLAYHDQEPPRS